MESREQIKEYLFQAIDTLTEEEVNEISAYWKEPDLGTFTNELIALKSEIKKNNSLSQKLTNDILVVTDKINESLNITEEVKNEINIDENVKEFISKIFSFDETFTRTCKEFDKLPEISLFNTIKFREAFFSWKIGFEILTDKWSQFLMLNQLSITGLEGEIFDSANHEAIETVCNEEKGNSEIVECIEKGYLYKRMLLRRAKVVINKI